MAGINSPPLCANSAVRTMKSAPLWHCPTDCSFPVLLLSPAPSPHLRKTSWVQHGLPCLSCAWRLSLGHWQVWGWISSALVLFHQLPLYFAPKCPGILISHILSCLVVPGGDINLFPVISSWQKDNSSFCEVSAFILTFILHKLFEQMFKILHLDEKWASLFSKLWINIQSVCSWQFLCLPSEARGLNVGFHCSLTTSMLLEHWHLLLLLRNWIQTEYLLFVSVSFYR